MFDEATHWPQKPLGELFELPRQPVTPSAYPHEEFAHYSIPAWDEKRGPAIEVGAAIGSAKIAITRPTILVSKLNPRIPRVVHVEKHSGLRRCASTEFIPYVAKTNEAVLRFYRWFFESHLFQRQLERIATGSTNSHKRARSSETLGWLIPFPKPDDQKSIAVVLETMDKAIAKTEAVIAKLKQVRAGLLHDLLTRGLDENGQLRDPVAHPEQFHDSPLGRIPREWKISTIRELDFVIIDGDRGSNYPNEAQLFATGFCVFLNNKNIVESTIDFAAAQFISEERDSLLGKGKLNLGDVVITTRGTVGNIALFDDLQPYPHVRINSGMIILRGYGAVFIPEFLVELWRFLFPSEYRRLSSGSAQPQFPIRDLQEFRLLVPDKIEQERIVSVLTSSAYEIAHEVRTLDKLQQLKSGLMNDLLTGRVRVPEDIMDGGASR